MGSGREGEKGAPREKKVGVLRRYQQGKKLRGTNAGKHAKGGE